MQSRGRTPAARRGPSRSTSCGRSLLLTRGFGEGGAAGHAWHGAGRGGADGRNQGKDQSRVTNAAATVCCGHSLVNVGMCGHTLRSQPVAATKLWLRSPSPGWSHRATRLQGVAFGIWG
eukprot:scaffold113095_cov60-Phaeocystis_antarctica.AAC.1